MKTPILLKNIKALLELSKTGGPVAEILELGTEMAQAITDSEGAYFHLFDEHENAIDLVVWTKSVKNFCQAEKNSHYPLEEAGIWADCARLKRPVIHNDYQGLNENEKHGLPADHFPLYRHMSIPVFSRDKIVAIIGVGNKKEPYNEEDVENVQMLSELLWSISEQRKAEVIINYAFEDGLTDIGNRRKFDLAVREEWNRHRRLGSPLSLVMYDIDFFKNYNDSMGHDQGDLVLTKVAQTLRESFRRSGELVCRYGGEEFIVILPHTTREDAQMRAEHARQNIEALKIPHPDSSLGPFVTVSGGVAGVIPSNDDIHLLEKEVDNQLYEAKSSGRNCIC